MTGLRVVTVKGTPPERGEAYGRQAGDLIERALDTYRSYFAARGFSWADALGTASEFVPHIGGYDPDLLTEIEAIARGADRSLPEIVLLNSRTELLFWQSQKAHGDLAKVAGQHECTGALALPEATRTGNVLHSQNWDWIPEAAAHTMALRVLDYDGPNALHFVEAGQLARHGMNETGVAVSAMGLHSDRDYGRLGVPSPVIRRKMIQAASYGDTIREVFAGEPSFSHFIMVSHAAGDGIGFESIPGDTFWLRPEDDLLVHANHIRSPNALARVRDVNLVRCPDSLHREARVLRVLRRDHGAITRHEIAEALADREFAPGSVLRSPAVRPSGLTSETIYSLIMDAGRGAAWLRMKPYQEGRFQEFSITGDKLRAA